MIYYDRVVKRPSWPYYVLRIIYIIITHLTVYRNYPLQYEFPPPTVIVTTRKSDLYHYRIKRSRRKFRLCVWILSAVTNLIGTPRGRFGRELVGRNSALYYDIVHTYCPVTIRILGKCSVFRIVNNVIYVYRAVQLLLLQLR